MKIFISAGHNIKDTGTSWGTLKENELTIKIRDELSKLLKGDYFYPPDNLTLAETIKWINGWVSLDSNSFALEIHFNANNNFKLRGTEAYYWNDPRYANVFSKEVADALSIPNFGAMSINLLGGMNGRKIGCMDSLGGAKPDYMSYVGELGFLRKLNCPSVIIECLYLTNENDRMALDIVKIAQGIKNGIDILFRSDLAKIEELKIIQLNLLQRILSILQAQLQKLSTKLGGNMEKSTFSLTQGGNLVALAGVILMVLRHYRVEFVTENELVAVLTGIFAIGGIVTSWIGRFRAGGITIGGFRKP